MRPMSLSPCTRSRGRNCGAPRSSSSDITNKSEREQTVAGE
jgi:hypothetical protein